MPKHLRNTLLTLSDTKVETERSRETIYNNKFRQRYNPVDRHDISTAVKTSTSHIFSLYTSSPFAIIGQQFIPSATCNFVVEEACNCILQTKGGSAMLLTPYLLKNKYAWQNALRHMSWRINFIQFLGLTTKYRTVASPETCLHPQDFDAFATCYSTCISMVLYTHH